MNWTIYIVSAAVLLADYIITQKDDTRKMILIFIPVINTVVALAWTFVLIYNKLKR